MFENDCKEVVFVFENDCKEIHFRICDLPPICKESFALWVIYIKLRLQITSPKIRSVAALW